MVGFASRLSHGHAPPACLGNFPGKFKKVRKTEKKLGAQKFLSLLGVIKGAEKNEKKYCFWSFEVYEIFF